QGATRVEARERQGDPSESHSFTVAPVRRYDDPARYRRSRRRSLRIFGARSASGDAQRSMSLAPARMTAVVSSGPRTSTTMIGSFGKAARSGATRARSVADRTTASASSGGVPSVRNEDPSPAVPSDPRRRALRSSLFIQTITFAPSDPAAWA